MDYGLDEEDDDRTVPKKKGDGAKKKPKSVPKPVEKQPQPSKAPPAAKAAPARAKPGPGGGMGAGRPKDPMSVAFGDSDISWGQHTRLPTVNFQRFSGLFKVF